MGIIKAATGSLGGALADQWLEVIEPNEMSDQTVFTKGIKVRKDAKRGSNRKGTEDVITDGSIVHVYENKDAYEVEFIVNDSSVVETVSINQIDEKQ